MQPIDQEQIYKFWDELSDFDASQTDKALEHYLNRLCGWIGADNAFWVGAMRLESGAKARRDAMNGWRPGAVYMLRPTHIDPERQKRGMREIYANTPADSSRALAAQAGKFRAYTLHSGKLVDIAAFEKTPHYDYQFRRLGISDRLWVVSPINDDAEAYYCFDKYGQRRHFGINDLELATRVMRGVKWFHRQLLLSYGMGVSKTPLTLTERRMLKGLLTDKTEQEIAASMGVTLGTAHQYATSIYRKFGTRGRTGLMSLWISPSP